MIINYKTGKLPPNFIYLGMLLLIVGVWRIIVLDWMGILFLGISLFCLLLKSGIVIDTDNKKLKKYIGFFALRKGTWKDINQVKYLQIFRIIETQNMSVSSITRTESKTVYKLILVLPNKNIELMTGEKTFITNAAEKISKEMQTTVLSNTLG